MKYLHVHGFHEGHGLTDPPLTDKIQTYINKNGIRPDALIDLKIYSNRAVLIYKSFINPETGKTDPSTTSFPVIDIEKGYKETH